MPSTRQPPAATLERCLKTEETTPLETQAREFKVYAPGIGLVQEADLKLAAKLCIRLLGTEDLPKRLATSSPSTASGDPDVR